MTEKQVVVSNRLVNYLMNDSQNAAAPSVVFLHGWGANAKIWQPAVNKLGDYNCYALDLPGFGKSGKLGSAFTVGDYAELVKGFIEKLEIKNVTLVGHSFGGRIAIKCSAEHFLTIEKLVLVDSAGFADASLAKSVKIVFAKIAKPFVSDGLRKKIAKAFGARDYAEAGELRETFLNIIGADLTEDMKKIKIPALIVWGEDDRETPLSFGEKMHSIIANSKFVSFPGAGHFSFLDVPAKFIEELRSFISL